MEERHRSTLQEDRPRTASSLQGVDAGGFMVQGVRGVWLLNRVNRGSKLSVTVPTGPLRFLATITSVKPVGFGLLVVNVVSVQEHHHVGVLLNGVRFAQVRKDGAFV